MMEDRSVRITARDVGRTSVNPNDYLTFDGVDARGIIYGPRKLQMLTSTGSTFRKCHFDGLRVDDAHFGAGAVRSEYVDCTFDRASLRAPTAGRARFVRCSFRDVRLKNWNTIGDFVDCVFTGRADSCVFHGVETDVFADEVVRSVEFRGNDFSAMEFRDVSFRGGIDLTSQQLPNGPDDLYVQDAAKAVQRAQKALRAREHVPQAAEALLDLDLIQREVDLHSQVHVYVRASDIEPDPKTRELLLAALRSSP